MGENVSFREGNPTNNETTDVVVGDLFVQRCGVLTSRQWSFRKMLGMYAKPTKNQAGCSEKMLGTFVFYHRKTEKMTRHGPNGHCVGGVKSKP